MGELGGSVTYLYWSERRIQKILSDNGIRISTSSTKVTSPTIYGLAPTVEYSSNRGPSLRADVAALIERSLGQTIISQFDGEPGARYASGTGTIVFGEFINDFQEHREGTNRRALIFTSCDYNDSDVDSVAICLFGSMDNYADYVQASGTLSEDGWTSSAAPSILGFLAGEWCDAVDEPSREEIAIEALKTADSQGMNGGTMDPPLKGWRRAFTFGDVQNMAEWLAEVYLDVDLTAAGIDRVDGYRRILVGAPIWIRTPRLRAVRLYKEYALSELEGQAEEVSHLNTAQFTPRTAASRIFHRLRGNGTKM